MPVTQLRSRSVSSGFTALGTTAQAASIGTVVTTVTANVSIGDRLMIFGGWIAGSFGGVTCTCADSAGNTYTQVGFFEEPSQTQGAYMFTTLATATLGSGVGTITTTFSQSCLNRHQAIGRIAKDQLILPATVDVTTGNSTSGTTPSPGSTTPTNVPDNCFAAYYTSAAATRTGLPPTGWTERFDFGDGVSGSLQVNQAISTDKVATNPAETLSATGFCCALIVRLKSTVVATNTIVVPNSISAGVR